MTPVAIALGSNLGDRERHLHEAARRAAVFIRHLRVSSFYDTAPAGVAVPQPRFLNAAAAGETALDPRALLAALLDIEQALGRERPFAGAPRTVDLDLILYVDAAIDEPGLVVPHPRFRERRFVLEPLAEIAADWIDPVSRTTVAGLLRRL
jgi:2-amino-4-hydroxy-6-hydroxymethyldihydropteridine diphosphokinase